LEVYQKQPQPPGSFIQTEEKMNKIRALPSSFRDRSGQVFHHQGRIIRTVQDSYRADYDLLMNSGLYQELVSDKLLIEHKEESPAKSGWQDKGLYKILEPEVIPVISYPYEWSFSAYKKAALLTLKIEKAALKHGLTLKDASSYNVQFKGLMPVFIDTLSFERYEINRPWVAYRQFCQHFLLPLSLMAYRDLRLQQLMKNHLDGVPMDLGVKLLPGKSRLNLHLFLNLHLHALSATKYQKEGAVEKEASKVTGRGLEGILDSLEKAVNSLRLPESRSLWSDYYRLPDMSEYSREKERLTIGWLNFIKPVKLVDLGANTGFYSRLAAGKAGYVVSCDFDSLAVEINYRQAETEKIGNLLPLSIDLINPSPGLGWRNLERETFDVRLKSDSVLALALIHHLFFSDNLPFSAIAEYLSSLGKQLIVEFVGPSDPQVRLLSQIRNADVSAYSETNFQADFGRYFRLRKKQPLKSKDRILYLLEGHR